jgi:hypothetical protein
MDRPVTPPPSSLLTPPPTGGFDKRVQLTDDDFTGAVSKRLSNFEEGEFPSEFFEQVEEGSDVELEESEEEPVSPIDDTPPTSATSATSSSIEASIFEDDGLFISQDTTAALSVVTEPFAFLQLPLAPRSKVYEHFLVVPGLICVRQNQAMVDEFNEGHLYADQRSLLPGISHASAQLAVNGPQIPFSRFSRTNISILLASKDIHAEAKAILYSKNTFSIPRPSTEFNPPTDYSVRLFPPGCQRLVTKFAIRIRSFYDLDWLLTGGHNDIKNFYRGLSTLTFVLKIDSVKRGFGRKWGRQEGEKWNSYVMRLQIEIAKDAYAVGKGKKVKVMPDWIVLRVLFGGEVYDGKIRIAGSTIAGTSVSAEQAKRDELKTALVEAWEMFKRGRR